MRGFWFIILILVSVRCSSDDKSAEAENLKEEFPKVNLKDFDTVSVEDELEFIVLKELTESKNLGERAIIGFSHLAKEKHFYLEQELVSDYIKSLKARKLSQKDILNSFAKEHLKDFKAVLKKSTESKFRKSEVNGMTCYRTEFEGDSNGFPKTKSFVFRYYQSKTSIYTIVCWTVKDMKSKFEKEALAMGLSLKELKK